MKKSLVLAMAMALGVTASAYAANPFSDVPAGHWAYDSINKLAAAGIVNGYEDGTFKGQKLMTRYEMAKIVATAMAKGANVDRLASEFADELDSLGVRVANLEKKSDNVKINGEIRYNYKSAKNKENGKDVNAGLSDGSLRNHESALRSRIWVNGQVNDDWKYVGMLENTQDFTNNTGDENTEFKRAYLEGKLGGMAVSAGRQDFVIADGNIYDGQYDGINVAYGDKVKLSGFYGKPTGAYDDYGYSKFWGAELAGSAGNLDLAAGYTKFDNSDKAIADAPFTAVGSDGLIDGNGIWNVGATYNFGSTASLGLIYLKSNVDTDYDTKGYVATATYAGAEADAPGSFGLVAKYYNQGAGTAVAHTMDGTYYAEGTKGWSVGANYTFAKNIVGGVTYYDTESKEEDKKSKVVWSELVFTF